MQHERGQHFSFFQKWYFKEILVKYTVGAVCWVLFMCSTEWAVNIVLFSVVCWPCSHHFSLLLCSSCWLLLYSTILQSWADSVRSHVIPCEWTSWAFKSLFFWISTEMVYLQHWLTGWCRVKLLLSQHVLCTPYNHAPCHFMQSHIHKVHVCLDATCTFGRMTRIFCVLLQ